jgi:hypothetical protein
MSALHGFAYAQARAQARHGDRLCETDWQVLEAARSTENYLDRARHTSLRRFIERLDAQMDAHAIERGLRAAWRSYVQEIADWMPQGWHQAVEWCAYLPDLAIIEGLVSRRALPDWAAEDPVFAALIESKRPAAHRGAPDGLPLLEPLSAADGTIAARWLSHWRSLWPGATAPLALAPLVAAVEGAFTELKRTAATAARCRRELERVLVRHFRRSSETAAAIFCHLGLVVIDIERVRGAILRRLLFANDAQRGAP